MAGRLLLGGGFRRMLIGQLVIRNFEEALRNATDAGGVWVVIRDAAKELCFDRVDMTLCGETFSERFRTGEAAAEWTAEVPLLGEDSVRLTRPFDATTHQSAMGPFLDTLRKGLIAKKLIADGEYRGE